MTHLCQNIQFTQGRIQGGHDTRFIRAPLLLVCSAATSFKIKYYHLPIPPVYCDATPVHLFWHISSVVYETAGTSTNIVEVSISPIEEPLLNDQKVFCRLNISSQMDIKKNWGSNSGKFF